MAKRDLINETYGRIGKVADANGIESLTEPQQTLLYAWMALGVVENGGFSYFYEVSGKVLEVIAAFRALGLDQWAEAFEASRSVFPGGKPEEMNYHVRDEWLEEHQEEVAARLGPYEQMMFASDAPLVNALLQHIERHPSDFA